MKLKDILHKSYVWWIVGIFILYLLLLIILTGFYNTVPLIIIYAKTINWFKLSLSIGLSLLIGFLVAITSVFSYIKYKERKQCKKEAALAGAGTIGGLVVGICPLCVTGVLPLILSFVGISFSFTSLPFQGIEIQFLVAAILAISLWMLNKH